ncbi:MAG: VCBS repeat-containing protein, partial [Zetaproteobacteria bacterium]
HGPPLSDYKLVAFDLSAYAGQQVQIRIAHRADWTAPGAYIDEIRVDDEGSDPDGDGIVGILGEYLTAGHVGLDPFLADTDGDGVNDGVEIAAGTDPLLATSLPAPVFSTAPLVNSVAGVAPDDLHAFDYNNDGYADVLLTGLVPGSDVYGMAGDGTGGVGVAVPLAPAPLSGAYRFAVGDLNGDGYDELVVGTDALNGTELYVLMNNQNGTFAAPVGYQDGLISTTHTRSVALADMNNDGYTDVVVGYLNDLYTTVYLGSANGTLTPHGGYPRVDAGRPIHLAVADFNGDGNLDVVDSGSIALGDGTGALGAPSPLNLLGSPGITVGDMAAADLNRDGKMDLVIAAVDTFAVAGQLMVFIGNGDGTFAAPIVTTTGGTGATGLAVADFNYDGKLDVAFADAAQSTVYIFQGNGDGTVTAKTPVVSTGARGPVAVDMDHDGRLDLVVYEATGVVRIWRNLTVTQAIGGGM